MTEVNGILEKLKAALAGTYDVQRELGEGGMATVYLAHDPKHGRAVAIKVLKPDLAASIGGERFLREIQIAAGLRHPNILPLYDSGDADGLLYYVMPFVEGEALRDRIDRESQLPIRDAVRICREVADALAYAHEQGVVHRDIKPENVLLEAGHAVVADFGIGRAMTAATEENLTQTGMSVGTPSYMSPEQISGDPHLDGRADIYSLGCTLYEVLVGSPPFTGPNAQAVMARHAMEQVPKPSIVRDTIPDDLENTILVALAKSKADRFQTAAQFSEALDDIDFHTMTHKFTATMPGAPPMPRKKSKTALFAGAGGAAAVALAVVGWLVFRPAGPAAGGLIDGLDPRRVAVLYFEDLSADGELAYAAEGLTEDLIAQLGRVRALDVVSRNGVAPYRDLDVAADSIARVLETGSLIEGSVENRGERLRVQARLVDGNSGADIDRVSVEVPVGDFLAAQDSVATEIAEILRRRLGEEVRLRERRARTTSVDAWSLVQRAEGLRADAGALARASDVDGAASTLDRADSLLALAEEADPGWTESTLARGWIAYYRSLLAEGAREAYALLGPGFEYAEQVLARVPGDARALELRGTLRFRHFRLNLTPDLDQQNALLDAAYGDLQAAVDADPSLATAYSTLSQLFYDRDDNVSAKLAAMRAYEEDAYLSITDQILLRLFWVSYDLAQFTDAQHWCDEGGARFPDNPDFTECQLWMMTTEGVFPDADRAWQLAAQVLELTPAARMPFTQRLAEIMVGGVLARAGQADSARNVLERALADRTADPGQELFGYAAIMYTMLGDQDEAVRLIQRYVTANPHHTFEVEGDLHWWWRPLRDIPGFKEVSSRR